MLHIPAVPSWHVVQNNIVCRDTGVVFKVTLQLPKCRPKVANKTLRSGGCTLIFLFVWLLVVWICLVCGFRGKRKVTALLKVLDSLFF